MTSQWDKPKRRTNGLARPASFWVMAVAALTCSAASSTTNIDISLDWTQRGAAISPNLFGQFIEHLGRCIHDGIWAEKLKDRKFLLALDKSPWHPEKGEGSDVLLDTAGAYAGEHCLSLFRREGSSAPCAMRQGGIGFVAGKKYAGYLLAAAPGGDATIGLEVSWAEQSRSLQTLKLQGPSAQYRRIPFHFQADATTDTGSLTLRLVSGRQVWLGCVSLMPADNVEGMRPEVLDLIRKLNPPITRWPGGNFVSGYNWKDGIGERDRRPPRWERAWNDVEDNDFGIDEFMRFCRLVGTEPYIAVNTGLGSARDAAEEVEYATGSRRTRWGAERARNGHPKPYSVTWWGVGNEMYGDWQLGNVPVERYALRHNAFVSAMRTANPNIKIIAVGTPGRWNEVMLPLTATNMNLLSGHHYTERKLRVPFSEADAAQFERTFPAYSASVMEGIRRLTADFRAHRARNIPGLDAVGLAIDEWGIVRDWNPAPDGPGVGAFEHYYTLGDALASARAVHELLRSADVVHMANWAQAVNVIGAIKANRNFATMDPVGHVLALYRSTMAGNVVPVEVGGTGVLDAVAARDRAGHCSLALINYSVDTDAVVRLGGVPAGITAHGWRINGPSLSAINIPGEPEKVTTESLPEFKTGQPIQVPAHSIAVLSFNR